jgi:hypothetical protein
MLNQALKAGAANAAGRAPRQPEQLSWQTPTSAYARGSSREKLVNLVVLKLTRALEPPPAIPHINSRVSDFRLQKLHPTLSPQHLLQVLQQAASPSPQTIRRCHFYLVFCTV